MRITRVGGSRYLHCFAILTDHCVEAKDHGIIPPWPLPRQGEEMTGGV